MSQTRDDREFKQRDEAKALKERREGDTAGWGGGREVRVVRPGNQDGESGRNAKEGGRKGETGGWNFSITEHTDNKDPDFKRL